MKVDLESVRKRFDGVVAVRDVSLSIPSGEFFFLLGPSGCGKTTLLRILAGFETPDAGRVLFDGADVAAVPPERRGTGMVFQNYALWPHLTVEQNIAFGLETQKVPAAERKTRIQEALALVRMQGYEARRPGQLSGGQQQRVALARALVIRPQLVLLDEPLSNLDARLRLEMRTEIREIIKQAGHTAVYVTHDQKEALSMADRCAILRDGAVEQVDTPATLYRRPRTRFVAEFLGETNLLEATVVGAAGEQTYTTLVKATGAVWRGTSGVPLAEDQRVVCSIRPEDWRIGAPTDGGANALTVTLKSCQYLGEATQLVARAGDTGPEIRVLALGDASHPPGPLELWTRPETTVLIPVEGD